MRDVIFGRHSGRENTLSRLAIALGVGLQSNLCIVAGLGVNVPGIVLAKKQREAGPGVELLALCQTVSEDGSLTDAEIYQLRRWLEENRSGNLGSIPILTGVVESILKDRKVTDAERRELQRLLEKVLPRDLRLIAVARRRIANAELREKVRAEKAQARAQEKAQRRTQEKEQTAREKLSEVQARAQEEQRKAQKERSYGPIDHANFMVAGTMYERRAEVIKRHVRVGDKALLVRDRLNKFSRNAIEVRTSNNMTIGYVPEEDAINLAPSLDGGALHNAVFTKVLAAGWGPIPVVDVTLRDADAHAAQKGFRWRFIHFLILFVVILIVIAIGLAR